MAVREVELVTVAVHVIESRRECGVEVEVDAEFGVVELRLR
jgi:hypothetical protein